MKLLSYKSSNKINPRDRAVFISAEAHQMVMAALEGTGIENEAQADLRALAEKLLRRES